MVYRRNIAQHNQGNTWQSQAAALGRGEAGSMPTKTHSHFHYSSETASQSCQLRKRNQRDTNGKDLSGLHCLQQLNSYNNPDIC